MDGRGGGGKVVRGSRYGWRCGGIGDGNSGFGDGVGECFVREEENGEGFASFCAEVFAEGVREGEGPRAIHGAGAGERAAGEVTGIDASP